MQLAPGMTLAERTAGYLHGPRYDVWSVRGKVTAGAFTNEVAHQAQFPALAAEELADDLEVWTQTNRGRLMENRKRR